MTEPILTIDGLTLKAGDKTVLKDASFAIPPVGLTALMGPVGTGKSSVLKWLCAKADPGVYRARFTEATFFRAPLSRRNRPMLYGQKQGQSVADMMGAFDLHLASNPAMFCVDEATAERSEAEMAQIMERLSILARSRAIMAITHNQAQARAYADHVLLIAGGRVEEMTPAAQFFTAPTSAAGRQFVGSGWVTSAGVDTPEHHLAREFRSPTVALGLAPAGAGGRLTQVVAGRLYLLAEPRPGDGAALRTAGVGTIATLAPLAPELRAGFEAAGLAVLELPEGATDAERCRRIAAPMAAAAVAVVQGAGAERAVALQLVDMGASALEAAGVAAALIGLPALAAEDEQELWDFELARDLEADGVDPTLARLGWAAAADQV